MSTYSYWGGGEGSRIRWANLNLQLSTAHQCLRGTFFAFTKKLFGQTRAEEQGVLSEPGPREQPMDLKEDLVLTLGSVPTPTLSPGPFAVISVMIGSLTESMLPSENYQEFVNGSNVTINEAQRDADRVELVATITVLTGIFQVRGTSLAWQGTERCVPQGHRLWVISATSPSRWPWASCSLASW